MSYTTQNVSLTDREKTMIQGKAEALGMSISKLMVIAALEYERDEDFAERLDEVERRLGALEDLANR